jgi:hypothetical protein
LNQAPKVPSCRVIGRLTGNFPGGTVDLKHRFTLAGDRISRLEIALAGMAHE